LTEDQRRHEWLVTVSGVKAYELIDESSLYVALIKDGRPEN
jgi:hypothetical protein